MTHSDPQKQNENISLFQSTYNSDLLSLKGIHNFMKLWKLKIYLLYTVNSEIFTRILFSPIALKDVFAAIKIPD